MPYFVSLQEPWNPEPYKFHKEMESATKDCGVTFIDRDTLATVCQLNLLCINFQNMLIKITFCK